MRGGVGTVRSVVSSTRRGYADDGGKSPVPLTWRVMSDPPASAASPVLVRVWNTRRPCFEPIAPRGDHWLLGRETLADDDRMSRRHCEIRFGAAGWVIEDLGSANGSHVNGSGWVAREPGGWWQVLQIGRSLVIPLCVPAGVPLRLRREQNVIVGPGLHRTWEAVGRAAQERGHLLLIGPRGCGFEGLARAYARARGAGVECSVQDLRRGTLPVATLTPGVVLVLGLGSLERLADDPWLRSAICRRIGSTEAASRRRVARGCRRARSLSAGG